MLKHVYLFLIIFFSVASCGVYNSNQLLRELEKEPYQYSVFERQSAETRINQGDELSIKFYPNNGEKALLSLGSVDEKEGKPTTGSTFEVSQDGEINIPLIGIVKVAGLTIKETATLIQEKLSKEFQAPFVEVKIINQRITLFNGQGAGTVIPLENEGTTLMEAIALAGGIKEFGKADYIKLFRLENGVRKAYKFSLANLNDIKNVDIIVQNKDLIVIDYHPRKIQNSLRDASPWISIITSGLAIFSIIMKI